MHNEKECQFCGMMVDDPCFSLDEWQTCFTGENETPIDRVEYFNKLIEDDESENDSEPSESDIEWQNLKDKYYDSAP